jgi:hypothetical protein
MLVYCRQNPGRKPPPSAAEKTRLREMCATGSYTPQQLADLFGLCYATVNRILAQDRPAGALYHSAWRRARARRTPTADA